MSTIATHDGIVVAVEKNKVKVEMHVVSACSNCEGREKCAFVDKADKIVEVETSDWKQYSKGESVIVSVNESLGLLAVLLAYILPAVLVVATLILILHATGSELLSATVPLAIVVIYYLILWRLRHKLQRKFSFGLTKK